MPRQELYRVGRQDYALLRPVLSEQEDIHLQLAAILEGMCRGSIYVDDVENPRAALAVSGRAHYLAGTPGNRAFNMAVNALLPRDTYFVLFCDPERWASALDTILDGTYAVRARSRYYTLARPQIDRWQTRVPSAFAMHSVDARLLAEEPGALDEVIDGILDGWLSVEAFLRSGFGHCLVHAGRVVSWSVSDYALDSRCEMGIHTHPGYRRRGLGTLTAAATAAQAVARGFTSVGWHCWDNNVGSIGVARKVGFEHAATYEVFINHWPAMNVSDMTRDEFRAFASRYEREFEALPPASGFPHVVAAKAWALSGDRAGCFRQLHEAVDLGWLHSVEQLRRIWPELWNNPRLEEMEEWRALAKRLEPERGLAG